MKQRSKILLALFLSASLAVTPVASVSVLAEDLDFTAVEEVDVVPEEEISDSEEVSTSTDDSVLADDSDLAADITTDDPDLTTDDFTVDTSTFSADEADVFTSGETSDQDVTEAKTHSIKVSVTNSEGVASGMYAMDDAIVTKQDDGTYLVKMHQASENRNYMALVNGTTADDITAATQHKVDWYIADSSYYYTIPVASLSDTVYASFSKTTNVNKGSKWSNVQTITFDTTSMADTDKSDVDASGMNKQAALDYSSVDAALATVPEDLSIYTDETANAVTFAVNALNGTYKAATQDDVDKLATAITDAVNALVKKAVEEAKTHSIKVSVTNSEGVASGMYAMDDAIVTKQDDGTYLVKMHQASENRNYMALVNGTTADDITAATQHKVDWYIADSSYYYTIPVASLSDTVYASFSKTTNVNKGSKWSNVQTITFDTTSMADTDKSDVDASGMNKQAALDYSSVDAALATVPEDLSIYTDETANAVTFAVNALNGTYKAATQDDVDKLATAIADAVNALVEKGLLTVTNETLMFNVEKAVLRDGKLIVTLHGQGYHYLYKGTYEEAVANGDNRENWIAGEQINGKWQFTIPVAEGETFLPIVAISQNYLTKYEEGKNSLERAFYPRQAVIDQDAATLVTGDYDHTKDLTVDNQVKMFNVAAASLETIGGPNSNNYQEILHLTMGTTSFDKVFIGSAEDAAKAETTTAITEQKADLVVKENAMGGTATTDYLEKDVIFSFHSVKNNTWYERVFNVSKTNGTLTITPVPSADYTAVDAALATVPEDLSIYTEETANAVKVAVDAVKRDCTIYQQADVDKMAQDITDAVNALVERGLLTVTNETLMFNVEKAVLRDGKLIVTLHGQGYHYLYKGTYEEAVANGDNRENWIAGEEINGKWQFTVPVAEGETYLPIVAISNSYLTKYEEGKNSLERAFYPRQAVIDQDAATLVTGDYDHTKDLTVDNSVKMFNVAAASLETIGGPNSNNYKEILHLTMGSDSFDKVFIGFAKDAAKAETTADITDRKVSFDMKANAMGGEATTDYLDKEVIFSFHSVKNGTWYERVFNVSKTNGTLTITPVAAADYTAVDAALAAVPKDLSIYTDETVAAVRAAVDAVNKNCTVYQQADVDKMASDITAAVKALVKKPVAAAKVTLNATSKKITTGKSFTLKATVAPSNTTDKVVWKSSNTKVATVSANGTVKAVKAGTAVITATAGKVKATCKVTVANPVYKVTSIKLAAAPSRYITAGKRVQLRATITPSNATNKAVTWKSSNTRIATVSSTGIVTFNKNAGGKKVTITATAKDGSKKYARITLACMKGSVKSIRLSGKTTVTNGQSTKVTAAVTSQGGSANRSLAWSSSNTKLATVDKYGKVKTIKGKKGTVTITAKATDGSGKKATIKIRIK